LSTLAIDKRTNVPLAIEAKRAVERTRLEGAKLTPWLLRQCVELLQDPDTKRSEKLVLLTDLLSRFGIPKRTNIDATFTEVAFSVSEMREIWRDVAKEIQMDPAAGRVQAINVEFENVTGAVGANGNGEHPEAMQ